MAYCKLPVFVHVGNTESFMTVQELQCRQVLPLAYLVWGLEGDVAWVLDLDMALDTQ